MTANPHFPQDHVLLVIDAQGDFMRSGGALYVPGAEEIIPRINRYLSRLDNRVYSSVIFTFDTHVKDGWEDTAEGKMFPIHCVEGTPGWHLAVQPDVIPHNIVKYELRKSVFDMWSDSAEAVRLYKTMWNATTPHVCLLAERVEPITVYDRTRDDFFFSKVCPQATTVEVCGVASDYCVRDAVLGLIQRKHKVKVLSDLTAGITRTVDQVWETDWEKSPYVTIV